MCDAIVQNYDDLAVSILYQLFQMSGGGNRGETVVIKSESPECVSHEQTK